ncbi:hypothetical protein JCM33374_g4674 [Metschnikowia sp. JCM 33374]|nr:hypothetical protein JCM33374_g4674 [Metschnikowia sp. JCM 33374]
MCELPYNVLNRIVRLSDRNDQIKLAQLNRELNHVVYSRLYKTIMVVDDTYELPVAEVVSYTMVRACDLIRFVECLNIRNFQFVDKVIINTHSTEVSVSVMKFYHKVSELWNNTGHTISFVNYDVLSLRVTDSLNNYLESNSIQFTEYDDGDYILAKKSRKIRNLHAWFMFDISDFLVAPTSEALTRLGLYIENNHYRGNADAGFTIEKPDYNNARYNLSRLTELFLHSALASVNFSSLFQELEMPQLQLRRLSLTSTHRLRNDAVLNFQQVIHQFNLNGLEELELKMSCTRHHECSDSCMVRFFSDWKTYNIVHGLESKIRKLSLIHHKSLSETTQFKRIVEEFVFDSHFSNVREIYINLSNTVRSPGPQLSVDLGTVIDRLVMVPELEVLHISSFMSEWMWGLPSLFDSQANSYHDILMNGCTCHECNSTRCNFMELAELDKAKNYSHKVTFSDIGESSRVSESSIDFSRIENIKFLRFISGLMKQQESIMERNITSSGTMCHVEYMLKGTVALKHQLKYTDGWLAPKCWFALFIYKLWPFPSQ